MRRASLLITAALLAACGGDGGGDAGGGDAGRIQVVAAFYPLAEAALRVGGEHVDVVNVTPAGAEPHDVELSSRDVDRLLDADLVLYVGGDFQPAVSEVVERRNGPSMDLLGDPRLGSGDDPHFWLDPTKQAAAAAAVSSQLADLDPELSDTFAANLRQYQQELEALDAELADLLDGCERDEIVTTHAAFGHLADRYDLVQLPISGLAPESEVDPARLDELVGVIEEHGVTTVFHEPLVPADVAETLAREAGVDTAVLDPIEGLTEQQRQDGADYTSVMRANGDALADALGCR